MKFSAVVLLASVATAASVPQLQARFGQECAGPERYIGYYDSNPNIDPAGDFGGCRQLEDKCFSEISAGTPDIWGKTSCVAAATCAGSRIVHLLAANCTSNSQVNVDRSKTPSLNYNIYADIVGDCAWAPGGCPITFQNFVDYFYGELTAIRSTTFPPSVDYVRTKYWNPIQQWTATGETIPYLNFNDWLHFYVPPTGPL
ncbi:hypothetical protein C8J56DRAFT_943676 [Mycena floridula]|nr:hypothetical protein C8J56DRAFT_943676 [Mycena floridula]